MNYIDIIILVILAFFIFGGLKKGLVRSVGGILGIFVAIYFSIHFYHGFASWLENTFSFFSGTVADIVSLILLFILINAIFSVLIYFVDKIFSLPILNFFNHLFGAIFGLVEGALLIAILLLILARFGVGADMFENSKVTPYAEKFTTIISPLLPKDLKQVSISNFLENSWINNLKESIANLPRDIKSVDDLSNYLKENVGLSESVIQDIKNTQFKGKTNLTVEEIKIKLQDYLESIKQ